MSPGCYEQMTLYSSNNQRQFPPCRIRGSQQVIHDPCVLRYSVTGSQVPPEAPGEAALAPSCPLHQGGMLRPHAKATAGSRQRTGGQSEDTPHGLCASQERHQPLCIHWGLTESHALHLVGRRDRATHTQRMTRGSRITLRTTELTDGRNKRVGIREAWLLGRSGVRAAQGPSAANPRFFAVRCDTGARPCVISPLSDGSLLGFVNRGLWGTLQGHSTRRLPYCPRALFSAHQPVGSGLGVTTLVALMDQPTLCKFLHYLMGPSCGPTQAPYLPASVLTTQQAAPTH